MSWYCPEKACRAKNLDMQNISLYSAIQADNELQLQWNHCQALSEVTLYEIHPKLEHWELTLRRKIQVVVENQELTISSFQAPGLRKEEDKLGWLPPKLCLTCASVIDLSCSASRDFFKLNIISCVPLWPSPEQQSNKRMHDFQEVWRSHQIDCLSSLLWLCSTPPSVSQPRCEPPSSRSVRFHIKKDQGYFIK